MPNLQISTLSIEQGMSHGAQPQSGFQTQQFCGPPAPSLVKRVLELFQALSRVRLPMQGEKEWRVLQSLVQGGWMFSPFLLSSHLFLFLNLTSLGYIPQRDFLVQADLAKQLKILNFWIEKRNSGHCDFLNI